EGSAAIIACQGSEAVTSVARALSAAASASPASRPLPARAEPSVAIRMWVYIALPPVEGTVSWNHRRRRPALIQSRARAASRPLDPVPAERRPHRGQQPVGVGVVLPRAQPLEQRLGDH